MGSFGKPDLTFEYDWHDVRKKYIEYFKPGADEAPTHVLRKRQRDLDGKAGWLGCTRDEALGYLENGYEFERLDESMLPPVADAEMDKWIWTDDSDGAEYQYDMDEAGEMEYYLKKKKLASKPGIRIEMDMAFPYGTSDKTISQFGAWIGGVVESFESSGYDLEIVLHSMNQGLIDNKLVENYIRISNMGELVFSADWAPVFAPGGYRHFFQMVKMLPEEQGYNVAEGLGAPRVEGFGVEWDEDRRVLRINCGMGTSFDYDKMNADLIGIRDSIDQ